MSGGRTVVCNCIVIVDSEFDAKKGQGECPGPPVCVCAIEIDSRGRVTEHRLAAPYPKTPSWERGDPYLTIVYSAPAEAGSYMNIEWSPPNLVLDLYAEYMTIHNTRMLRAGGDTKQPGPSLIEACRRYRVRGMDVGHKSDMRHLAYSKTDHTPEEIAMLQDYCLGDDCRMTLGLARAMWKQIDFMRAPIRGAFMWAISGIHWRGIPIDVPTYRRIEQRGGAIAESLREDLCRKLGANVYYHGVFKRRTMFAVMRFNGIPIPIDPKTGKYSCATRQIKSMIGAYPLLGHFYEDKRMIDAIKSLKLEVGADGRNRFWLNPFGQKTGRNNPTTNCLLGLPHTMRSLMKPPVGMAIAQVDYGAQEVGIAALSRDSQLMADYLSGDPYEQFAVAALNIDKPTKKQRAVYKAVVLRRKYGKGAEATARDLGITVGRAQRDMRDMDTRYPVLNAWLGRVTTKAAHFEPIVCSLGWSLAMTGRPGEHRTFLNFSMQANGSEMMRLVVVRAAAAGLRLIGVAHDGFYLEAPIAEIERDAALLQEIMRKASRDLLGGFELRADCKPEDDIVKYPARFIDKREREDKMVHWNRLMQLIGIDQEEVA